MAWERRKTGGLYYTQSERINGRVVRRYIGKGEIAEVIASVDDSVKAERKKAQADVRAGRAELDELELLVAKYDAEVSTIVNAALSAAGYHRHQRGPWRRKRNRNED